MRRTVLLVAGALLFVAAVVFGPALASALRLQSFITDTTKVADAGGPWPRVSDSCTTCHGARGNSANANYPSLAAQPPEYLTAQLRAFASGQRSSPAMGPLARTMNDAEIDRLARFFADQTPRPNTDSPSEPGLLAHGQQLVEQGSCAGCHGEHQMGQAQFPRLAGQSYAYLVRQLDAFASGTRTEASGTMQAIARATPPGDRKAMAAFLSAQPPQPE